ncbi:MAG: hypothetical protein WDA18_06165 [Candidatus Ratteibacteria bacterium]
MLTVKYKKYWFGIKELLISITGSSFLPVANEYTLFKNFSFQKSWLCLLWNSLKGYVQYSS